MLFEEKTNLARLMATENLFVEERNVQTAYFDLKTRVLTIPILDGNLSSNLYDLLLGHEVSHALETPYAGWHDSIVDHGVNKSILNVCEDARIEKKIKRKFPGIRSSFLAGYQELVDRDFFQIKNKNIQTLNLIDRINLYTKVGSSLGIEFTDEEKQLVKEVENTESFNDVVIIAKKIQLFMREQNKNPKKFITKTMSPTIEDDGDTFELDLHDDDDKTDSMSNSSNNETTEDDKADSQKETVDKNSPSSSDDNSDITESESDGDVLEYDIQDKQEPLTKEEEKLLESVTDKAFRRNEKDLLSKQRDQQVRYLNIPKVCTEDFIVDYKKLYSELDSFLNNDETLEYYNRVREIGKEEFLKYKKSAENTVSYLVKEFELRKNADQQSRVKISKSGEINVNKVHEYSFTDDIFKRMTKMPNGKSHGLVLYLDWSGSMQKYIHQTIKQVINIVLFCRKCNIPFEVYAFSNNSIPGFKKNSKTLYRSGDIVIQSFSLFNLFSSKMNNNAFTKACTYMYNYHNTDIHYYNRISFPHFMNLSSTPLNEAIICAFEINSQFKLQNKLDIVNTIFLTDGDGHSINTYRSGPSFTTFRQSKNDKVYIRDLVTKTTFLVKESSITSNKVQTNILMRLLKKRLNCKIVGFMIVNKNDLVYRMSDLDDSMQKKSRYELSNDIKFEDIKNNFNKNKYHIITNSYADEFYLLKSNALDTEDDDFDDIQVKSIKSLSTAFSKYSENKIQSRVILNRFINLIS